MNYHQKLSEVVDFIGKHLDEEISLDKLSEIFCVSRFHFHRLFTAFTGLSLLQYIKWLRLKRAAHQLIVDKDKSIIEIALSAGFESHEAFTRAFKKACGLSPNEFRQKADLTFWEKAPYSLPKREGIEMKVDIRNLNKTRLAIVEHRGDPKLIPVSINKLIQWSSMHAANLKPKAGESFAIAYDDPNTVPPEQFRIDFGMRIPENMKVDGDIVERYLPAGRYAVAMHKGSRSKIADTVYALYRDWLPNSGEELGDLPCVFCYHNFDHEVAETESLTECWLLLK